MAFNPNDHMMKLKGKDYLQVAWRLVWFREDHPDFGINAEALALTEDHAIFKATITDANGTQLSSGHGSESKKDFGDFIEKAETKAIGRALAMLGYGTQFAADELDEGDRIVDSPINRGKQEIKPDPLPADALQPGEKMNLPPAGSWNPKNAIGLFCKRVGLKLADFANLRTALIAGGIVKDIPSGELSPVDFDVLCKAMEANYPEMLKVSA
jgi:hypothetical protein